MKTFGGAFQHPSSILLFALAFLVAVHFGAYAQGDNRASVLCSSIGDRFSCKIQPFSAAVWSARGSVIASTINTTGWGSLEVESNTDAAEEAAAYGAGFIEGYLTFSLIDLAWLGNPVDPSDKAAQFIQENVAWVLSQAKTHGPTDPYWHQVGLVYIQQQGLYAGYVLASNGAPALTANQLMYFALQAEENDIELVVNPSSRPDWANMDHAEFKRQTITRSHCSAIFKVTADFSDVLAAHDTWSAYTTMLRLIKSYTSSGRSASTADLMLSSYPGVMASIDDFYLTSQQIVITETTNNVFNNSLFDLVTVQSVPYWVRVTVASKLATSAQQWHDLFYKYNSGTYNNQWMTLDYKLFTPTQPLQTGLFWVSEQLPGYHHSADQTMVLQRGYWPSYNAPFYEDIYRLSGYPEQVKRHGPVASYQLAPRASLFRKYAGQTDSFAELQSFMLLNTYGEGDPLAGSPYDAIAARGDLDPEEPLGFGAIDSKMTSASLARTGMFKAISGPTHMQHPPFAWTGHFADQSVYPHYGQPRVFNFSWVAFSLRGENGTRD